MTSITLLVGVGVFVAYLGWVSKETEIFLPKFLTKILLPPFLMCNIVLHFNRSQLLHVILSGLVPLASMFISFFIFRLLATPLRVDTRHRGLFAVIGTVSNTILVGIPVNMALFGESSLPYVLLYFFANTVFFWTFGCYVLASEGTAKIKHTFFERLKLFFSPPLCGVLTGITLVVLDLGLPKVLVDTCQYLGQLTTPLALMFVGIILQRVNWKETHMGKDIILCLIMRLGLSPLILVCMLTLIPLPLEMARVFIIQSALPCMVNISVMSAYYNADKEYGSTMVAITTLVGLFTLPIWMTVIHTIQF